MLYPWQQTLHEGCTCGEEVLGDRLMLSYTIAMCLQIPLSLLYEKSLELKALS